MVIYPFVAYFYLVLKSSKYFKSVAPRSSKVAVILLSIVLLGVITLIYFGFKEDVMTIDQDKISISGMYSESFSLSELKTVEMVETLPPIKLKVNGFALGDINKGYFRTQAGEKIKLVINSDKRPLILLIKGDGRKIYYSSALGMDKALFEQIKGTYIH